jgi:hypothetical protein
VEEGLNGVGLLDGPCDLRTLGSGISPDDKMIIPQCFCNRSTGDTLIFVVSKSGSGGQMSEDGIQVTLHSAKLEFEE